MNLKDFVKDILKQLNEAVDEARIETSRDIQFREKDGSRSVEFDIAITVEKSDSKSGKAGVSVIPFIDVGGDLKYDTKNSTVSRVTFGLFINPSTKMEREQAKKLHKRAEKSNRSGVFELDSRY